MEIKKTDADRYYEAQKRVREIKSFYQHLIVFVVINIIVMVINLMTSPGYLWFLWCLLGWGVAIVLHGLVTFEFAPFFDKKWEERKIKSILDKEANSAKWE